jgi:hypothetical protein
MEQFEFTAWSLYTGPSYLKNIIDDSQCPWVVGKWNGINNNTSPAEIKKDIDLRIDLLLANFKLVLPQFKTYNRHFVVPEFYFHCQQGPYPNCKVDGVSYPLDYIQLRLQAELKKIIPTDNNYYSIVIGSVLTSNIENYTDFLNSTVVQERMTQLNAILAGKINLSNDLKPARMLRSSFLFDEVANDNSALDELNNFMKLCRANPFCTVRNRGIYFFFNSPMMQTVQSFIYEKQFESTVDLTMGILDSQNKVTHGGMITEWMANYPSYSILLGDKQTDQYSTNARFTPDFFGNCDLGVEICLDHRLQRLRRTVGMTKANGASADNYPLFKQIVPSGGMQLLDYSIAADRSSVSFNADGCDKIYVKYGDESTVILKGEAGLFNGITCGVYNHSVQSKWKGKDGNTYYSHSQLAFTTNNSIVDGFNNALGLNNLKAITNEGTIEKPANKLTDSFQATVQKLAGDSDLFGAGIGELHNHFPIE